MLIKLYNADKIIKIIVDIVSQDISKDITFDNIKSYYRYLKIKEKIELYLVAYELLFTYPNFATLVQSCKGDNINHKRKSKKLQGSVKEYSESSASEEYRKGLKEKIKSKDITKAVFLFEKMQLKKLDGLSFSSITDFIKEIDSLSTINDNDLLRYLVLGNSIEIEKHFTCKGLSSEVSDFCKEVSLYVIAKKYLDKEIYFPFTLDYSSLSKNIKNSFIYLQRIKDFWVEVGDFFIRKEDSFEQMIKKYCDSISWDRYNDFFHYDDMFYILRVLSLVEFYSKQYDHVCASEFLEDKSLDIWSEKFISMLKKAYSPGNLYYINILLFELNSIDDSTRKENIYDIFSKIDEAYKDFCKNNREIYSLDSQIDFIESDKKYKSLRKGLIEVLNLSLLRKLRVLKKYKKTLLKICTIRRIVEIRFMTLLSIFKFRKSITICKMGVSFLILIP